MTFFESLLALLAIAILLLQLSRRRLHPLSGAPGLRRVLGSR